MQESKPYVSKHIDNFSKLRSVILDYLAGKLNQQEFYFTTLSSAVQKSCVDNGYFTENNIRYALNSIADIIQGKEMSKWLSYYELDDKPENISKKIGVVMAGNIPLVGFHDFLCVIVSGNQFLGKLSKQDRFLLPALADILMEIDRSYKAQISFTVDKIQGFDAVIATGSNNTARYFDYYFGKYPNIIRKNRNSIAILNGEETKEELTLLVDDMFLYFGLGCRNISKLFVPIGYDFKELIQASQKSSDYINHNNFRNNYDYYKTIFLMNNLPFYDCGFYLIQESPLLHNPVAVFNFEYYSSMNKIIDFINENSGNLQCIVGNRPEIAGVVKFGEAQKPGLMDYADNIDTLKFLLSL